MFQVSNAFCDAALTAILTTILVETSMPAEVHLAVAPFTPNPNSDPATFTEASYTGYAAVALGTWAALERLPTGSQSVNGTVVHFAPTGTAITNTVVGYWIVTHAGVLIGYDTFPAPIPMDNALCAIDIVLAWQQQLQQWANVILEP
jgi:hypothetical protein